MTLSLLKRKTFLSLAMGLGLLALVACGAEASTPNSSSNAGNTGPRPAASLSQSGQPASQEATTFSSSNLQSPDSTGLWVTGQGTATGTPDLATINLGVQAFAASVAEARGDAAAAMEQVIAALRDAGVAERDIQTTVFTISPRHTSREVTRCPEGPAAIPTPTPAPQGMMEILPKQECFVERESVITGFQVTNQVSAQVRDLPALGNIIDRATEAGGDLTRFQNVSFSIEDTSALEDQARREAVADLQHKAGELASLMGVELGRPLFITEGRITPPTPMPMFERMAFDTAAQTPVLPGEVDVRVTVQAAFAIQ